jgi:RecJ-like exonuclease
VEHLTDEDKQQEMVNFVMDSIKDLTDKQLKACIKQLEFDVAANTFQLMVMRAVLKER